MFKAISCCLLLIAILGVAGEQTDKPVLSIYYVRTLDDGTEVWCTEQQLIKEDGKDWNRTICLFYTPVEKS